MSVLDEIQLETQRVLQLGNIAKTSMATYDQQIKTYAAAFQAFREKTQTAAKVNGLVPAGSVCEFLDALFVYTQAAEKHTTLLARLIVEFQELHTEKLEKL
jgi:hypothetical protein